jgi:hypothetical protein
LPLLIRCFDGVAGPKKQEIQMIEAETVGADFCGRTAGTAGEHQRKRSGLGPIAIYTGIRPDPGLYYQERGAVQLERDPI